MVLITGNANTRGAICFNVPFEHQTSQNATFTLCKVPPNEYEREHGHVNGEIKETTSRNGEDKSETLKRSTACAVTEGML